MRMNLKPGVVFLAAAALLAAGAVYLGFRQAHAPRLMPAPPGTVAAGPEIVAAVYLYFGDRESDYLTAESRSLTHAPGAAPLGRAIVEALIAGPRSGRRQTVPGETRLRAFYLTDDATAYVDLSEEAAAGHPGGAQGELMTVYSIVNSLILNVEDIQRVKILVEGAEVTTLAGHIDLREPLAAHMLILR